MVFGAFQHARKAVIEDIEAIETENVEPAQARNEAKERGEPSGRIGIGRQRQGARVIRLAIEMRRKAGEHEGDGEENWQAQRILQARAHQPSPQGEMRDLVKRRAKSRS